MDFDSDRFRFIHNLPIKYASIIHASQRNRKRVTTRANAIYIYIMWMSLMIIYLHCVGSYHVEFAWLQPWLILIENIFLFQLHINLFERYISDLFDGTHFNVINICIDATQFGVITSSSLCYPQSFLINKFCCRSWEHGFYDKYQQCVGYPLVSFGNGQVRYDLLVAMNCTC